MSLKNFTFITSVLFLMGSVASAAPRDLGRFVGQFELQDGGRHCPASVELANTTNAHEVAFKLWELAKIQMPKKYKAKARVSSDEISQAVYSSTSEYYLSWAISEGYAELTVRIGYWKWSPVGEGSDRFDRFIETLSFSCQYDRIQTDAVF